ncbi:hypothetical protein FMEAI12_3550001 [Parafrankia sp. Ea1.12]|nr:MULTISPECIES: hypothetical protein [unclassified Parafrankia]SQD96203.1 hypothetical protein FMEAI12_3550001 [Parafrankia sp. Ea1.12]
MDGTDHRNHRTQASVIRRYIIWRNKHVQDKQLRQVVDRGERSLTRHYHPASRFWPFQWYKTGIYVALTLALAGLSFWCVRCLS